MEKITPFLKEKGFIKKKSKTFTTFNKITDSVYQSIRFNSYSNSTLGTSFSVTWNKVHEYYDKVLHGEHMGCTILCPTHFFSDEPNYDSKEKQENAISFVKMLYTNYAIPFFDKTSTIYGVIENLRANFGVGIVRGDVSKGLLGYHDSYYELFLTRLVYPEQFEDRVLYYKETMNKSIQYLIDNRYTDPHIDSREDVSYRFAEIEEEFNGYREKLLKLDVEKLRLELEIQI